VGQSRLPMIIEQAALLFDGHGYHQTTMEDIAEEVGIKKPTLYHYVASKEEILFFIHEEFVDLLFACQAEPQRAEMSCDLRLKETMRDLIRLMTTHRSHVRVFFEHHRELSEPFRSVIDTKRDAYFQCVVDIIAGGIEDGTYRLETPELGALAMFGMCNWAYTWFRADGQYSADATADLFWQWLSIGFRMPPGSVEQMLSELTRGIPGSV